MESIYSLKLEYFVLSIYFDFVWFFEMDRCEPRVLNR